MPFIEDIGFVVCPECGAEQADMGRNVACEECGQGPMPFNEAPSDPDFTEFDEVVCPLCDLEDPEICDACQ